MKLEGINLSKKFLELTAFLLLCLVLRAESENITKIEEGKAENKTEKPAPVLTGDPQKDYIHDPNLPRELNGFNLSDYPFYKRVPNVDFNFSCVDRKDGFYASIPHKCQVYHHCLFEVRYDFLCANYTAFDQSKFICQFANEVDCANSEFYFDRNDALYVEETTTTTTTAAPQVKIVYIERNPDGRRPNRRKSTTASPADDYYYDYDYNYNDDQPSLTTPATTTTTTSTTTIRPHPIRRRPNRPLRGRPKPESEHLSEGGADYPQYDTETIQRRPSRIRGESRTRHRQQQNEQQEQHPQPQKNRKRRRRKKTTSTTTTTTSAPEYYDEYYYYDDNYDVDNSSTTSSTTTTTPKPLLRRRRPGGGQVSRLTTQDRRKALLQSRKSQVQRFSRPSSPKPQKEEVSKPQNNYEYDDILYTDYTS